MSLNTLLYLLLVIIGVYCALTLYVFLMQPKLIYYPNIPTRTLEATPEDIGLDYEDVTLDTRDGERVHAWFIPHTEARGTLLFAHGNAGNISHRLDSIRFFHELGLNVLIFDYRGYGQSSGKTTEDGTYRDADAAWAYLADKRGIAPGNIILFGRSLGAAVIADLATRVEPAAVILESAFFSVPDMAAVIYPWLPVRWLASYRYDNGDKVTRIRQPKLIIHSRRDEIIPFEQGVRLFESASEPKQFLELRGRHNDGFYVSREAYTQAMGAFLDSVL
jgi:fermentation-respiration switch protein FrsA (DUF1100 family)